MTTKDDGYKLRLIASRPADPDDYPPPLRRIYDQGIVNSGVVPTVYSDETEGQCATCDIKIMIGPRSRQQIAEWTREGAAHSVLCLICASIVAARESQGVDLSNMDNPEGRR